MNYSSINAQPRKERRNNPGPAARLGHKLIFENKQKSKKEKPPRQEPKTYIAKTSSSSLEQQTYCKWALWNSIHSLVAGCKPRRKAIATERSALLYVTPSKEAVGASIFGRTRPIRAAIAIEQSRESICARQD